MAEKVYRMLDSTIIYKGHEEIEAELNKRGIDFECPYDHVRIFVDAQSDIQRTIEASEVNVLEHVVGRTVALVGDNSLLADLLTEEGYIVEQLSFDEVLTSKTLYDTVVSIGYGLNPIIDKLSKWSTVMFNDGEVGFNYKFNDGVDEPKRNLAFRGNVLRRYKSGDTWFYDVATLDTDKSIRLSSADLFTDNTIVVVRCDGLVIDKDNIACVGGQLEKSRFDVPHSFNDVLRIATDMNVVYQATKVYTVEDFITQHGLNERYSSDITKLIRGYVGTDDEVIEMLEEKLPEAFIVEPTPVETEDEAISFEVTHLTNEDDQTHRVLGVVLEPNTSYGKDGIWFSAKTIENIAHNYLVNNPTGALDHLDNSEVRIVESYVAKSNEIINGNKVVKGTWLVSCQVTDEVYEAIKEGKYTGLSIKGRAING